MDHVFLEVSLGNSSFAYLEVISIYYYNVCLTYEQLAAGTCIVARTHADTELHAAALVVAALVTRTLKQEGERHLRYQLPCPVAHSSTISALVRQSGLGDHQCPVHTHNIPERRGFKGQGTCWGRASRYMGQRSK